MSFNVYRFMWIWLKDWVDLTFLLASPLVLALYPTSLHMTAIVYFHMNSSCPIFKPYQLKPCDMTQLPFIVHYWNPWMNLGKTEWWKVGKWQEIIQWKGWIGYTGLTGNIYLSGIALSRMTLAKHTKVAINMNTRMPGFKHGMVTSDTERQDSSHHVKRGWV